MTTRKQPLPTLSLDEIERLERGATPRELLLVRVLYETGCRVSELARLSRKDLLPQERLRTGGRSVRISTELWHQLRRRSKKSFFLFATRESPVITPRRIEQLIAHLSRRVLGRRLAPKEFRSARIIHDFQVGVPVREIERKVGLKSISSHLYRHFSHQQSRWAR